MDTYAQYLEEVKAFYTKVESRDNFYREGVNMAMSFAEVGMLILPRKDVAQTLTAFRLEKVAPMVEEGFRDFANYLSALEAGLDIGGDSFYAEVSTITDAYVDKYPVLNPIP